MSLNVPDLNEDTSKGQSDQRLALAPQAGIMNGGTKVIWRSA